MGDFDSSDDDNVENLPPLPHDQFRIDWLNLPRLGLHNTLALSALPGCRLFLKLVGCFEFVVAGFWLDLGKNTAPYDLVFSYVGFSDSGSNEETLRKMWR